MVPKKTLFERMGLIDKGSSENDENLKELSELILDENNIPDLDNVPDLSSLFSDGREEKKLEEKKLEEKSLETLSLDGEKESREKYVLDGLKETEVKTDFIASSPDVLKNDNLKASDSLKEENRKMNDIPKDIGDKLDLLINAYEKNKMLTIDEIYRNSRLETDLKKSIFMADVYLKAIPENLPMDIKRETVLNIMNVSNISLDELLNDAYRRIDSLNTVLEDTVSTTQQIFSRNEATIRELEKRIEDLKEINKVRKQFQEDQNTMIEYEIQKIINLVEFVKPKK